MDFKRYFGKIKNKDKKPKHESEIVEEIEQSVVEEVEPKIVEEVDVDVKKTLNFVDSKKDPHEYLKRYLKDCLLYTSPSPRDRTRSRMPSSA